jgi:hypothetical protein
MPNPLAPTPDRLSVGAGVYQYGQQPALPLIVTGLSLSGYTRLPSGQWQAVNGVQLDPGQTRLSSQCSCPIHWQLTPM